jgi:hypothetical protein
VIDVAILRQHYREITVGQTTWSKAHLRDFRDEPDAATLEAGSLSVAATRTLLVTGRRIPLLSVKELEPSPDTYGSS